MTNPTPHGQVPEALRLAEQYDHGDPATHGNAWKAAVCTELRRQHTRIAELEAEIAGGVQALSAAPAGFVPVAAFDRLHAHAESLAARLLAASPTPPAEQPIGEVVVTKDEDGQIVAVTRQDDEGRILSVIATSDPAKQQTHPGAVYAELHEPDATTVGLGAVWNRHSMRDFADRTHALRMQAAPKAAPGVGNGGFDHKTAADLLSGKTVSDEAVRKFVAASRWAHDEKASLSAMLISVRGVLASREAEIALLKKALLEAEAAPQQEAQEPVWDGKLSDAMQNALDALYIECGPGITRDITHQVQKECEAIYTSYTTTKRMYQAARDRLELLEAAQPQPDPFAAPQPAPAPLSESEYKRGYRDGYERRDAEVRGALV